MIEIHTTRSSMLNKIAYEESSQELFITFSNNTEYKYFDVSKEIFNDLVNAESEGKYFTAHIKSNFKFEKL